MFSYQQQLVSPEAVSQKEDVFHTPQEGDNIVEPFDLEEWGVSLGNDVASDQEENNILFGSQNETLLKTPSEEPKENPYSPLPVATDFKGKVPASPKPEYNPDFLKAITLTRQYPDVSQEKKVIQEKKKEIKKYKEEDAFLLLGEKKFPNCTHTLEIAKKKPKNGFSKERNEKFWLVKKLAKNETEDHLIAETLAQELHRLILDPAPKVNPSKHTPHSLQPKTRVLHLNNGKHALVSEQVDFKPLSQVKDFSQKIKDDEIRGLGAISAMAYIVADSDRHIDNVGVDLLGDMVSLDNGHAFKTNDGYKIDKDVIDHLPFIVDGSSYQPSNYFGLIKYQKDKKNSIRDEKSSLVTPEMANDPYIKREKYDTFMKFMILSDEIIRRFVRSYTDTIKYYSDFLIDRRNKIADACLQLEDFRKYCINDAEDAMSGYIYLLPYFKTMSKNLLLKSESSSSSFKTSSDTTILSERVDYYKQLAISENKKHPIQSIADSSQAKSFAEKDSEYSDMQDVSLHSKSPELPGVPDISDGAEEESDDLLANFRLP